MNNIVNSPPKEFLLIVTLICSIIVFLFWFFNSWADNKIQTKTAENAEAQELANKTLKEELALFRSEKLSDRANHTADIKELKEKHMTDLKEMKQLTEELRKKIEHLNNRITDERIRHSEERIKLLEDITNLKMVRNEEKTKLMEEISKLKISLNFLDCELQMEKVKCERLSKELSGGSRTRAIDFEVIRAVTHNGKAGDTTDDESPTPNSIKDTNR